MDRQRRARRALGVVLMRQRVAEQAHEPVAKFLGHVAAHFGHCSGSGVETIATGAGQQRVGPRPLCPQIGR